jgi:hypothetical protein
MGAFAAQITDHLISMHASMTAVFLQTNLYLIGEHSGNTARLTARQLAFAAENLHLGSSIYQFGGSSLNDVMLVWQSSTT